jgi:hypothetical protein
LVSSRYDFDSIAKIVIIGRKDGAVNLVSRINTAADLLDAGPMSQDLRLNRSGCHHGDHKNRHH